MNLDELTTTNKYKLCIILGGKCRVCLEDKPERLEIDHIYNDGAEERTKYGSLERIYGWYLQHKEKAFERLQPLCKNCHLTKHFMLKERLNFKESHETVDLSVLQGKPRSEMAKVQLLMDILRELEGDWKKPVEEMMLVNSLIKTEKFTEKESRDYIKKILRDGTIYESKPGHFNRV